MNEWINRWIKTDMKIKTEQTGTRKTDKPRLTPQWPLHGVHVCSQKGHNNNNNNSTADYHRRAYEYTTLTQLLYCFLVLYVRHQLLTRRVVQFDPIQKIRRKMSRAKGPAKPQWGGHMWRVNENATFWIDVSKSAKERLRWHYLLKCFK